jgi:hypothetical protein
MPITKINSLGVNLTSPLTFSAGTAALPSITFSGDTNTGVFAPAADTIGFTEGGAEAMRIDSNGNVMVGITSSNSKLVVVDANNRTEATAQFVVAGAGYSIHNFLDGTAAYIGQNSNSRELRMYSGSSAGTGVKLTAGATSWVSTSDETLKDIIEPIENAVKKISTLRAVIGKYKDDADDIRRPFLIAQDVEKVLPEAIHIGVDKTLNLAYTETIPLLVAAIKEQQTIIEELKARLTALESK